MKKLYFLLILLIIIPFKNRAAISDTIVINMGSKKKVIIYGETKADLREIEKFDLNKAVRQMNAELENLPLKTKKLTVRDYNGDTYLKENTTADLSVFRNFIKNTHLNLSAGVVDLGVRNYQHQVGIDEVYFESYGTLRQSRFFAVNITHAKPKMLAPRVGVMFEKSIGYNFMQVRGTIPFNGQSNLGITAGNGQLMGNNVVYDPDGFYVNTFIYDNGQEFSHKIFPSKIRSGMLNARFQPTFFLADKQGRQTFKFGAGVFANVVFHGREVLVIEPISPKLDRTKFGSLGIYNQGDVFAGLSLSAGYKFVNLFWEKSFLSNQTQLRAYGNLEQQNPERYALSGRLGYTTMGIRLGR